MKREDDFKRYGKNLINRILSKLKTHLQHRVKNEVEGQILVHMHPFLMKLPTIVQFMVTLTVASISMVLYILVMSILFFDEPVMYSHLLYGSGGALLLGLIIGSIMSSRVRSKVSKKYHQHIKESHMDLSEWFDGE